MACRADQHGLGHRQAGQPKLPAGPAGQQRDRGRGEYRIRRPGDHRQRGLQQQEPGGVAGLGGAGKFWQAGVNPRGELGFGAGRVRHAQAGADPGHVGDVPIPPGLIQRVRAEACVGAQEAVGLGDVHPGQQARVGRRVRPPVRRDPGDLLVHRPDPRDRLLSVAGLAERGDGGEVAGALQAPPRVAAVPRMPGHRGHRQRMQRLQQQRPDPADEHRRIRVHLPDRPVPPEPALVGQLPPRRVGRPGDPLDDRRTDTTPNTVGDIWAFHLLIIPAPTPAGESRDAGPGTSHRARTTARSDDRPGWRAASFPSMRRRRTTRARIGGRRARRPTAAGTGSGR